MEMEGHFVKESDQQSEFLGGGILGKRGGIVAFFHVTIAIHKTFHRADDQLKNDIAEDTDDRHGKQRVYQQELADFVRYPERLL